MECGEVGEDVGVDEGEENHYFLCFYFGYWDGMEKRGGVAVGKPKGPITRCVPLGQFCRCMCL